jgi:hypothetical protein
MSECILPQRRTPNSIHVSLFKGESLADETRREDFAGWPQAVQNLIVRELDRWARRNPDKDIIEQNYLFDPGNRVCVMEFHYAVRAPA